MRSPRSFLLAVCALATVVVAGGPSAPAAGAYLAGVDVSHWQGAIDWAAVREDPQHIAFAIEEASWGEHGVDPLYASNSAGALTHGILVAAYHFAYPDPSPGEAVREADHFADTAAVAAGEVVPALDLESGGLVFWPRATPGQLIAWTRAWLERVRARTGLRALVYTNPSFWTSRMGNTTLLASAGYPLWIAHWGVSSPAVPASDWAGHGWECWQYTDAGNVQGIRGSVDMDWLDPASIQSLPAQVLPPAQVPTKA